MSERDKMSELHDMSADNTAMHIEEASTFMSMAPLAVRGPFNIFDSLREWNSKQRLRYKMGGFNLDMRYITPNVIALASPAKKGILETASRNHIDEVNRFFRTYHKGHIKCYNLIAEMGKAMQDAHRLDAIVVHDFAFLDHEVPGLSRIQVFCNNVKAWLQLDPQNVAVLMCRSGRNRTGIMACCYLLFGWPTEFQTASDAIAYFSWCRMRVGGAIESPSQRRYISYFAQRFAATPQRLQMSRVFIPIRPLKQSKIRLEIFELVASHEATTGNENEIKLIWTSRGKQMGGIEEGQTYVFFDLPDNLVLSGDIKLVFSGRKFSNGSFTPLFSFWFNCGFIDHTPVVWDVSCFDNLAAHLKAALPEDFHVQTLFIGKPRVACSLSRTAVARVYCWDCEDPFMSEEESVHVHVPRTVKGSDGEDVRVLSGPPHRFHPLVEEDCAICKHRHEKYEKGQLASDVMDMFEMLEPEEKALLDSDNAMEFLKKSLDSKMRGQVSKTAGWQGKAYTEDEGLKLSRQEKEQARVERRKEVLYHAGKLDSIDKRPPLFGLPSVFCPDTGQFMCSWCNKNALREKDRKGLTRYALPLVQSSELRYSGCARQMC